MAVARTSPLNVAPKINEEKLWQALILRARQDPVAFTELQLAADGEAVATHDMHRYLQAITTACERAGKHLVIVGPPEHGKTSQIAQRRVWNLGHRHSLRCALVARDGDLAARQLVWIRKTLLNKLTKAVFPELEPDVKRSASGGKWNAETLYMANQPWPAFEVFSLEATADGARIDDVWCDDVVTAKARRSEAERNLCRDRIHQTWLRRITKGKGIVTFTNNPRHRDDPIYQMRQSDSFCTFFMQYFETDHIEWGILHPPVTWKGPTSGRWKLWSQFSKERLEQERKQDATGLTYKHLFEGKLATYADSRFPPYDEWATYNDIAGPDSGAKLYAHLDPNGGKQAYKEDFAACILLQAMPDGEMRVIEARVEQNASPADQINWLFDLDLKYRRLGFVNGINRVQIEAMTNYEKWIEKMVRDIQDARRSAGQHWELAYVLRRPSMHKESKESRIEMLDGPIRTKALTWPADLKEKVRGLTLDDLSWKRLVEQMEDFPYGDKDDGPDALAGTVDLARRCGVSMNRPTPEKTTIDSPIERMIKEMHEAQAAGRMVSRPSGLIVPDSIEAMDSFFETMDVGDPAWH
jgi:hypothetical protein